MTIQYDGDEENATDVVARSCSVVTLCLGLLVVSAAPHTSSAAVGGVLVAISAVGIVWFLYALDLKAMLTDKFFLALQLYAQAKAAIYTETRIKGLLPPQESETFGFLAHRAARFVGQTEDRAPQGRVLLQWAWVKGHRTEGSGRDLAGRSAVRPQRGEPEGLGLLGRGVDGRECAAGLHG